MLSRESGRSQYKHSVAGLHRATFLVNFVLFQREGEDWYDGMDMGLDFRSWDLRV
jgi:hypothetical protein